MLEAKGPAAGSKGTPFDWMNSEAGNLLQRLYDEICILSGAPVTAVKFKKTEGGWLLVLNAVSQQRGALVCFYAGETVGDCVDALAYDLTHKPGVKWKPDRYG